MFVHDLPRSVSTVSVVSESRASLVFPRAVSEVWIWFAARYLQRQCGGVAHDVAAPEREPEFDSSRAVSAPERSSGPAQRLPTIGSGQGLGRDRQLLSGKAKINETNSQRGGWAER